MKFFVAELVFYLFVLGSAQTPRCFNLGPFHVSGSIKKMRNGFSGTLDVSPTIRKEVQLFLSCSTCKSSYRNRVCDCKIVTKLSSGYKRFKAVARGYRGAIRGVAFAYGKLRFNRYTKNTLIIAGGGGDLRGGYGTFTITYLHEYRSKISFTAKVDPCIFGGVNPFLPSVHITAGASAYTGLPPWLATKAYGRLKITCGSGHSNSCTVIGNSILQKQCSINCIPGDSLTVSCIAYTKRRIADFKVKEKIKYGTSSCIRDNTQCTYQTTVFHFDTHAVCTFRVDYPPPSRPPRSPCRPWGPLPFEVHCD